jgi:hypothetical protein
MKVADKQRDDLVTSGITEQSSFKINTSAKAFKILSSGLYANKIKAIIRELSCNAVDSQKEAKETRPFEVHLPTDLQPFFSIRDFGTGLDDVQINEIYTTYFASTKTDSNDYIGALGLGSKSPFAYTDNFSVTTVKDGVKGVYGAYINDQGVPSIGLMDRSTNSDEPNGVTIQFGVESCDFRSFSDEATSVFKWFKDQPKFTGQIPHSEKLGFTQKDIIPGVHIQSGGYNSAAKAVMGNICYPIDIPSSVKVRDGVRNILDNCNLVMYFEIGELDLQPSREGLSYDESTIRSIIKKCENIITIHGKTIKIELDAIKNEWELFRAAAEKARGDNLNQSIVSAYMDDRKAKSKTKTKAIDLYETSQSNRHYGVQGPVIKISDEELERWNIKLLTMSPCHTSNNGYSLSLERKNSWNNTTSFQVGEQRYVFAINDTKIGPSNRVKYHYTQNRDDYGTRTSNVTFRVLTKLDKKKAMRTDLFFKAIKNPPESMKQMISDYDKAPHLSTGTKQPCAIFALTEEDRYNPAKWESCGVDYLDDTKKDKKTTFVYVNLKGFEVMDVKLLADYSYNHLRDCLGLLHQSRIEGLTDLKIHGVRKNTREAVKKRKNWILLDDYIAQQCAKVDKNVVSTYEQRMLLGEIPQSLRGLTERLKTTIKQKDSKFFKAISLVGSDVKTMDRYDIQQMSYSWKTLFAKYNPTKMDLVESLRKITEERTDLHEADLGAGDDYPCLGLLLRNCGRLSASEIEILFEYIELVDKSKGL